MRKQTLGKLEIRSLIKDETFTNIFINLTPMSNNVGKSDYMLLYIIND